MKHPESKEKNQADNYVGWKKSWHKWVVLTAGIVQLISFFVDVNEYREIANSGIFSDTAWEMYAMLKREQFSIKLLSAICLLIVFVIGIFAKDKITLKRAEIFALLSILIIWVVIGICFQLVSYDHSQILFGTFCLLIGGALAFILLKKRN